MIEDAPGWPVFRVPPVKAWREDSRGKAGFADCKPQPDRVGLDMLVDLLEDRHPLISLYLQIKGMRPESTNGKKPPSVSRAGAVDKPIELEHLDVLGCQTPALPVESFTYLS